MTDIADERALVPLPSQPADVPWPTGEWPEGRLVSGVLDALLEEMFDESGVLATTYALVLVQGGRLVFERYAGTLPHFDRPPEPVTATTPLLSWSMAKSMLHATVGMLVEEGRLELGAPAPVPEWAQRDDPRRTITLENLLAMRDGLSFNEDYVDDRVSDVIDMLFGSGAPDMAHFAADRTLAAPPGSRFSYSSGTSNIVSGIVAREVGPGAHYQRFLSERLFGPLAMRSARATFDEAGTWVASSYVHATARDFARFGLLYLRGGVFDGVRLLPEWWVDTARTPRSVDVTDDSLYALHWWVLDDGNGTFRAAGFEGQTVMCCPALDLVLVRCGKTPDEHSPELVRWRARVVDALLGAR